MSGAFIDGTQTNEVMSHDPTAGIQENRHHVLTIRREPISRLHYGAPVFVSTFRTIHRSRIL